MAVAYYLNGVYHVLCVDVAIMLCALHRNIDCVRGSFIMYASRPSMLHNVLLGVSSATAPFVEILVMIPPTTAASGSI